MKLLPMLDHVMLVALRIVAILFLIQALAQLSILFHPSSRTAFLTPTAIVVHLGFAVLLIVCSWMVPLRTARRILALLGVFRLILFAISIMRFPNAYFIFDLAHLNRAFWYVPIEMLMLPLLWLISDLAMIWVACRPPQFHTFHSI